MKFVTIVIGWVLALLCACLLNSCGGNVAPAVKDATFIEQLGDIKIICLYGIRYGQGDYRALTPLVSIDGYPLPCEDSTPETCEKKLFACQMSCIADQTTLREIEGCPGFDAFYEQCLGGGSTTDAE